MQYYNINQRYTYNTDTLITTDQNIRVYKGVDKTNGNSVRIQIIEQLKMQADIELDNLYRILSKAKLIQSPFIVPIIQVIKQKQDIFVITQYNPYGTIFQYLKKHKFFSQIQALYFFKCALFGLSDLHFKDCYHGYINLQNFQLEKNGKVKLAFHSLILKAFYLSPQFKSNRQICPEGDIFSLGICLYKMLYGVFPFSGKTNQQIIEKIKKCDKRNRSILNPKLPFQVVLSGQVLKLLQSMLGFEKRSRPNIMSILKMNFMDKIRIQGGKSLLGRKISKQVNERYMIVQGIVQNVEYQGYYRQQIYFGISFERRSFHRIKISKQLQVKDVHYDLLGQELDFYYRNQNTHMENINFFKVYEHQLFKNYLTIVFDYHNQGSFYQYLKKRQLLSNPVRQPQLINQLFFLLDALKTIQSKIGQHAWLHPKNIYISSGHLKVGAPKMKTIPMKKKLYQLRGSHDFYSPQIKRDEQHKKRLFKSDVWSFGMIFYTSLTKQQAMFDFQGKIIFPGGSNISKSSKQIMKQCLQVNGIRRCQLQQIILVQPDIQIIKCYYGQYVQDLDHISKIRNYKKINQLNIHTPIHNTRKNIPDSDTSSLNVFHQINNTNKKLYTQQQLKPKQRSYGQTFSNGIYFIRQKFQLGVDCISSMYQHLNASWFNKVRLTLHLIIVIALHFSLYYFFFYRNSIDFLSNHNLYSVYEFNGNTVITKDSTTIDSTTQNCVSNNFENTQIVQQQKTVINAVKGSQIVGVLILGIFMSLWIFILHIARILLLDFGSVIAHTKKISVRSYTKLIHYILSRIGLAQLLVIHFYLFGDFLFIYFEPCLSQPFLPSLSLFYSHKSGEYLLRYLFGCYLPFVAWSAIIILNLKFCRKQVGVWTIIWSIFFLIWIILRGGGWIYGVNWSEGVTYPGVWGIGGQLLQLVCGSSCFLVDVLVWLLVCESRKVQDSEISEDVQVN